MRKRKLDAEALWSIPRVGAPLPSPDGRTLLVPVTTADMEKNTTAARLWIVASDGRGDPRALTATGTTSDQPCWSADGSRIAFARKEGEKRQIHVISVEGGEAERVTDLAEGAFAPRFHPDGRRIVFLSPVRMEKPVDAMVKARVTENRLYRAWDHWLTDGTYPHLHVLDLRTRKVKDLTPRLQTWIHPMEPEENFTLSPDGREIAYCAYRSRPPYRDLFGGLYVLPIGGGKPREITPDGAAAPAAPRYSPDGRHLLVGSTLDPHSWCDRVRLFLVDRRTGRARVLHERWSLSPASWEFDARTGALFCLAEREGRMALHRCGTRGAPREVARGGYFEAARPAAGRVFVSRSSLTEPPEVFSVSAGGGDERRLTSFTRDAMRGIGLGRPQEFMFRGSGGDPVQMFLLHPPGKHVPRPLPLVHLIHGGPYGSFADQWHWRWNSQVFAARGFRVAMVNFHGSSGWGQDFTESIVGAWGDKPYDDIMRATDHLVAKRLADPRRMAAAGGSYGGYLASWIASQTDRFACIVNHAGVCDLQTQFAMDFPHDWARQAGGDPGKGREGLDRHNPMRHAAGFRTPLLITHGELDYRVPCDQAHQIYSLYQLRGRKVRMILYPDENHWILKPRNSRHWYREVTAWLARFTG